MFVLLRQLLVAAVSRRGWRIAGVPKAGGAGALIRSAGQAGGSSDLQRYVREEAAGEPLPQ